MCAACAAAFALALAFAPAAFATDYAEVEEEATPEQVEEALASGAIRNELPADVFGVSDVMRIKEPTLSMPVFASAEGQPIRTLAGYTLYDTAAAEALFAFESSNYAIIASGESAVDALAATSLAGALNCPILLTPKAGLPDVTADALRTLGVKNAIIVGGAAVIPNDVASQIQSVTGAAPERLWGQDQFETQLAIYAYGASRNVWGTTIIAARGVGNPADALSAAPLAYSLKAPVFLVNEDGILPRDSIVRLTQDARFTSALALGGTAVMSDRTIGALQGVVIASGGSRSNVVRIAGESLYDTSVAIADWSVSKGYLSWDNAALTTGLSPYDALAGSVVQGRDRAVMLLSDDGDTTATDALLAHSGDVTGYKYFGGRALFSNASKLALAYDMGFALSDIEGMIVYIDAGHGMSSSDDGVLDPGASGNGYLEYQLTADLARLVCADLNAKGIYTFCNDDGGDYRLRNAEAAALDCGCLVSIHFNANGGSGTETYIHASHAAPGAEQLRTNIHPKLVAATGLEDRGAFYRNLAVCGGSVPGTLLEICFIDNSGDMAAYQARKTAIAMAIAEGIAL